MAEPIEFAEQTSTLGKPLGMTCDECGPLPVFVDKTQSISCWRLTWRERLSALICGKIWIAVMCRGNQPPVWAWAVKCPFVKEDPNAPKGKD